MGLCSKGIFQGGSPTRGDPALIPLMRIENSIESGKMKSDSSKAKPIYIFYYPRGNLLKVSFKENYQRYLYYPSLQGGNPRGSVMEL